MKKLTLLASVLFLTLGACSTSSSIVSYRAIEVPSARPVLEISPDLLTIEPLSAVPTLSDEASERDVEIIHKRSIIFGGDAVKYHGQLGELIGAIKQREHSEQQILIAEQNRAEKAKALVGQLNNIEAERGKGWMKRIFGGE